MSTPIDHVALGLSRITSEYQGQPNFSAYLTALLAPANNWETAAQAVAASIDIDVAVGTQLDLIGQVVGIGRNVPNAYPLPFFGYVDTPEGQPYANERKNFSRFSDMNTGVDYFAFGTTLVDLGVNLSGAGPLGGTGVRRFVCRTVDGNTAIRFGDQTSGIPGRKWYGSVYVRLVSGGVGTVLADCDGATNVFNAVGSAWQRVWAMGLDAVNPYLFLDIQFQTVGTYEMFGVQIEIADSLNPYFSSTDSFTSRASTGYYYGSNGLLTAAAVNGARLQYNPENLTAPPLLLVEGAATNLWSSSTDLANADWPSGSAIRIANDTIAPDGTKTAALYDDTGASAIPATPARQFTATSSTMSVSIFTKARTALTREFSFYNVTAAAAVTGYDTVFTYGAGSSSNAQWMVQALPGGWFKLSVCLTGLTPGSVYRFHYGRTAAAASGDTASWYLWGAQVEAGPPTSLIVTPAGMGLTASRAADVAASTPGSIVSYGGIWYNQGTNRYTTWSLDDPTYRKFLRARVVRNRSAGTIEDFISILQLIFPSDDIIVQDVEGQLRVAVGLGRVTTATEEVILSSTALLPKPAGVALAYVPYTQPIVFFGFNPTDKTYGDATLGGGGPFYEDQY